MTNTRAITRCSIRAHIHCAKAAACAAHARRKFEELSRGGPSASALANDALQRFARIYQVEGLLVHMDAAQRQQARQQMSKPLWDELKAWMQLEGSRVLPGSKVRQALDYSLRAWDALTLHLNDGAVAVTTTIWNNKSSPGSSVRKTGCSSAVNWLPTRRHRDESGAVSKDESRGTLGLPARRVGPYPHPPQRTYRRVVATSLETRSSSLSLCAFGPGVEDQTLTFHIHCVAYGLDLIRSRQ